MYVIVRTMKIEKGFLDKFVSNFHNPSPITKSPGFVKKEMLTQTKNQDFDLVVIKIYFEDKKAFYVWEGSPEHIALHKNKDSNHMQKPEGLIEVSRDAFQLIATVTNE